MRKGWLVGEGPDEWRRQIFFQFQNWRKAEFLSRWAGRFSTDHWQQWGHGCEQADGHLKRSSSHKVWLRESHGKQRFLLVLSKFTVLGPGDWWHKDKCGAVLELKELLLPGRQTRLRLWASPFSTAWSCLSDMPVRLMKPQSSRSEPPEQSTQRLLLINWCQSKAQTLTHSQLCLALCHVFMSIQWFGSRHKTHDTSLGGRVNTADDRTELRSYSKPGNQDQENRMQFNWAMVS